MSFIQIQFYPALAGLLAIVALCQRVLRKRKEFSRNLSKLFLLLFSYVAMALYDVRFCACITGVILLAYLAGIGIERAGDRIRRLITVLTVIALLAILGLFKYLNFFMSTLFSLTGRKWTSLNLILPLGISFYIFSAIGYVLDVSWGKLRAERSLLDMALFLAFFPKQVCGPIVNARDFLPQLKEDRHITIKGLELGIQIFVFGLFKKIVLADRLAVFVDDVFYAPSAYGTATIWLAAFGYFLQLYFDFSGYSDMAIGVSKMFGYDLARNFNLPFIARNIDDFWDRWHISLSSWLNEYLFNPIALRFMRAVAEWPKKWRKKAKNLPSYAALLITFALSGLWHGAGFTFIVWGLLHGLYSIAHGVYANWMKKRHRAFAENKGALRIALDVLGNFFVLSLIQVIFRAESLAQAVRIFGRMFTLQEGIAQPYTWSFFAAVILLGATVAACLRARGQGQSKVDGYYPLVRLDTVRGVTLLFIAFGLTIMFAYVGETYFIYGNF